MADLIRGTTPSYIVDFTDSGNYCPASGGQVIVGTNCTRKSLSEALNEINQ